MSDSRTEFSPNTAHPHPVDRPHPFTVMEGGKQPVLKQPIPQERVDNARKAWDSHYGQAGKDISSLPFEERITVERAIREGYSPRTIGGGAPDIDMTGITDPRLQAIGHAANLVSGDPSHLNTRISDVLALGDTVPADQRNRLIERISQEINTARQAEEQEAPVENQGGNENQDAGEEEYETNEIDRDSSGRLQVNTRRMKRPRGAGRQRGRGGAEDIRSADTGERSVMDTIRGELEDIISTTSSDEALREAIRNENSKIGRRLRDIITIELKAPHDKREERLEEIAQKGSRQEIRVAINSLMDEAGKKRAERTNLENIAYRGNVENIHQLSQLIMERNIDFSEHGEYPLLKDVEVGVDPETGEKIYKQEFQKQNFLKWVRRRAMFWHGFNPDDPVQLLQDISIFTGFRQITLKEMIDVDTYFTDPDTRKVMDTFKDQCLHEVWLFNNSHNYDVQYRTIMGIDSKVPEIISQIYWQNVFTKKSSGKTTLEWVLTMPGENEMGKDELGQAVRGAILAYYYLYDYDMLRKILPEDSPIFQRDYEVYGGDYKKKTLTELQSFGIKDGKRGILTRKKPNEPEEFEELPSTDNVVQRDGKWVVIRKGKGKAEAKRSASDEKVWNEDWFDPDTGRLRDNLTNDEKKDFMEYINIFNDNQRDIPAIQEIRERISQSIMQEHKLSYEDAKYAENWAFSMARWTGIGAKNDTEGIGFDAWTKVLSTQEYRMRQGEDTRGSTIGNLYNVGDFKALGVDFFNGVLATDGKTLLELIQGGQGDRVDLKKDIKGFEFRENSMRQFADDHAQKSFAMFQTVIDNVELSFDQFTSYDILRGYYFDPDKANKAIENVFKHFRNGYSTFKQLDFSKQVRVWETEYTVDKTGKIQSTKVQRTVPIARALFGKEVLKKYENQMQADVKAGILMEKIVPDGEGRRRAYVYKNDPDKEANVGDYYMKERSLAWKQAIIAQIKAEIYSHRSPDARYKPYTFAELESIYGFLEKWHGGLDIDEEDRKNNRVSKRFFDKQTVDEIRRDTRTEFWRVGLQELSFQGGLGLMAGLWKALQLTAKEGLRTAA